MPSISNFYPSKWLTAADLPETGLLLTIESVELEKIRNQDGSDDEKPVIHFVEHDKGLVCNKTNAKTIASLYGDDTDDWEAKTITLYPTEVDFKGQRVDAIRVRNKKPKTTKSALAVAPASSKKPVQPLTQEEADEDYEDELPF